MADSEIFIDLMLWTVYVLTAAAVGVAVWAVAHGVATHERHADALASRYTSSVGYAVCGLVVVALAVTALLASTQPVVTGGRPFTDTLWLRLTDMFIFTSLVLICVCSVIVAIARSRR